MFSTYVLKSVYDGSFYIGSTENFARRLAKHNRGLVKSTKSKRPFVLIYQEEFESRREAYKRELQIKSYKSGNAFKKLISQDGGVVKRNSL